MSEYSFEGLIEALRRPICQQEAADVARAALAYLNWDALRSALISALAERDELREGYAARIEYTQALETKCDAALAKLARVEALCDEWTEIHPDSPLTNKIMQGCVIELRDALK